MALFTSLQEGPKAAIFGREPAVWVGLLEGVLAALLAFGIGITQESYGPWVMLISALAGLLTAWLTKDTMLGALIGFAKAFLVWLAVYGVSLNDQQTGVLIGLIPLIVGFFQRTQTSPVAAPIDPSPAQVTRSPLAPVETEPGAANQGGI